MYNLFIFDKSINMKKIANKYYIILPIIILNIISMFYLYNTPYFTKHLIFMLISLFSLLLFSKLNLNFFIKSTPFIYIISILLLTIVLIFGKEINGAKAWIKIFGISIQPSEITKLTLSIYIPYLTIKNKKILYLIIITIIPTFLTFLEPDTGAIIFYFIIFASSLKYSKINKKILSFLFAIFILFIVINIFIYFSNQDILINIYGSKLFYRIDRLISFKNQNNIQNINSLISIGSHNLIYIPENHNDFIFAATISKLPLLFPTIIISYIIIFTYYLKNISNKKNISNIINITILNTLLFQVFYNIFMNLSLVPIIGIPIPFISYGGSYLVTLYTLIGISINLNINKNKVV